MEKIKNKESTAKEEKPSNQWTAHNERNREKKKRKKIQ